MAKRAFVSKIISRSRPVLRVNLLEFALHDSVDARRLFVKMLQTTRQPNPGLLFFVGGGGQFLFDSFGHEDSQGDAALGSNRLGPAEDGVRDFKRGLHRSRFPYLWEQRQTAAILPQCENGLMIASQYPDAIDPSRVGTYSPLAKAGGGYDWDDVLEYRVWCHPERGAADAHDGSDYYFAFATYAEAAAFSEVTPGAEEPLA